MPSQLASRDSPRARHSRRRAPRGQLARSSSLFGTLKNIVTAPFSWLTTYDDQENHSGKRGRNISNTLEDESAYHEDQPSAKRKRVDSPELAPQSTTRTTNGYLDVPENLLVSRQRQKDSAGHGRSSSLVTSLSVPVVSGAHPARRTTSPTGLISVQLSGMSRTQSMDPPAYRAISLSRDVSMEEGVLGSVSRDVTMSPSRHTPFQLRARSSLTPQSTGQTFGPIPRHKERETSEPPPLAALISNPVFVKPPPQMIRTQSEHPLTTLGSLAETGGRISRSPLRQHSSLFLGARPGAESRSTPFAPPINAAEQALHDLDVYKTPLLPSRLRGSQTIPDMFKPKKAHAPVLMRSDHGRERKPRLGTSEKQKGKKNDDESVAGMSKPYAGRGGMKKMLARRRLEEQEQLEKEGENAIDVDQDDLGQKEVELPPPESPKKGPDASSPPILAPMRPVGGRQQSSLRVGRTRTSRNHPISVPFTKNRFSAVFEDDEGEDPMTDETCEQTEPKKLPMLYESPKGFTFAQNEDKVPVLQDSNNANAPIPALPFSLVKTSALNAAAVTTNFTQPLSLGTTAKASAVEASATDKTPAIEASVPDKGSTNVDPLPAAPMFPAVPSISFIPPSPAPAKPVADAPGASPSNIPAATITSVPNFFANSSIFSKPGVTIAPPTASPPAPDAVSTLAEAANQEGQPAFSFGVASLEASVAKQNPVQTVEPIKAESPMFPFSGVAPVSSQPSCTDPSPVISSKDDGAHVDSPSAHSVTAAPIKDSIVQTPPQPSAPFSFASPKPAERSSDAPKPSFSFGTAPMSSAPAASAPAVFSIGQRNMEPPKESQSKQLFSASEPARSSLFGALSSPPPGRQSGEEISKPTFTFGQSATTPSNSAATVEAPKPLFPSASVGGTAGFSFSTTPSASATPTFTFGVSSTPAVSAPTTIFGGPSTGSQGSDVSSKPFTFGSSTAARSLTPPHKEHDMRMEESPTRYGAMDTNGDQQSPLNSSKPFSFGAHSTSASSPFGQPSPATTSPFSFGPTNEAKIEAKPASSFASFGQTGSASSFSFGQKSADSAQSPLSPAPFGASASFGQAANAPTAAPSAFTFGAPSASSGFGQPSNSQPTSPSTFGAPATPFAFSATPTSATAPSNPFGFGSQPASPATGNAGLPQPPGSSGGPSFTFGAPSPITATAPSSPFGAAPSLPTAAAVPSFTMGSAPQTAGPRLIKKLPARRGGRRP